MVSYEIFKGVTEGLIGAYLPENMNHISVSFAKVQKVNIEKDGIRFLAKDEGGLVGPTIYMDNLYQHFIRCNNYDEVMKKAIQLVEEAFREIPFRNLKEIPLPNESNIICQLVNTKQNQTLLKQVPHRAFCDLSIIYCWVTDFDCGTTTSIITNKYAEIIGYQEEDLYKYSMKNRETLKPTVIRTIWEYVETIVGYTVKPEEIESDGDVYVITNCDGCNGASAILDKSALHTLAGEMNSSFYLIPSSIHEFIALRPDMVPLEHMIEMVRDINISYVEPEERLSNQIYFYNKETKEITQLTDVPYSLDGTEDSAA